MTICAATEQTEPPVKNYKEFERSGFFQPYDAGAAEYDQGT